MIKLVLKLWAVSLFKSCVCVEREGHQIPVSALLFLEAVLRLTRRWRKGDTKAIKATLQKFFLFIILSWWPVLWNSCRGAHWVYHDQCLALAVYVEAKYVVLHRDWKESISSFPSLSGLTLFSASSQPVIISLQSDEYQAGWGQSSAGTAVGHTE